MFKKNTAVTGFPFGLVSATDGSAITSGTPVGYVTLDGGAQTAIGDVTPVHEGNGQWTFDLTAGEMNGDIVGFLVIHASAINVHFTIRTDTKIVSELNDAITAPTAVQNRQEMDSNSTQLAAIVLDTSTTLDDHLTDIKGTSFVKDTHSLIDILTDVTGLNGDVMRGTDSAALASALSTHDGKLDTVDANVDLILVDTGTTLETHLTDIKGATFSGATDSLEAIRDQGDAAWITATGFATAAALATHDGKLDTVDANVDLVLADTADMQPKLGAPAGGSVSADIAALQTDTDNIQTRIPAALVSGKMSADAEAISGSTAAADNLEAAAEVLITGAAIAGTLSTTEMTTDLTEATDDHYNGRIITWTSGVLLGQSTNITDYTGSNKKLTFTAVTEAPSATDTFVIS